MKYKIERTGVENPSSYAFLKQQAPNGKEKRTEKYYREEIIWWKNNKNCPQA